MKNSALTILLFCLAAMSCYAQKENMNPAVDSIKISLSTGNENWLNHERMPVTVDVLNDSPSDINLKIHSIRFHLTPV